MPARSKPLPCEAGIQVKREQDTLTESLETAKYRFIHLKSATLLKSQSVAAQTAKNAIFLVWTDFLPCVG